MKTFHVTLNLTFDAKDEQEALDIAKACKELITNLPTRLQHMQPYKVGVDIDDVEEN